MSKTNGRNDEHQLPPSAVAGRFRIAASDVVTLVELQLKLLKADVRDGSRQIIGSAILLAVAGVFALACFPVALVALALGMAGWFGISHALAFLFSFLIGLVVTCLTCLAAYLSLRKGIGIFDRSRTELVENVHWIKMALGGDSSEEETVNAGSHEQDRHVRKP